MKLTDHFSLEEMTVSHIAVRHGIDNNPNGDALINLRRLAEFLEKVRALLNRPIHINSAYRSPEVNNLVGSKSNSQHCFGCAADITVGGLTPDQVMQLVIKSDLKYDQVIREFNSWIHISITPSDTVKPRKQALIIDKNGTRPYG